MTVFTGSGTTQLKVAGLNTRNFSDSGTLCFDATSGTRGDTPEVEVILIGNNHSYDAFTAESYNATGNFIGSGVGVSGHTVAAKGTLALNKNFANESGAPSSAMGPVAPSSGFQYGDPYTDTQFAAATTRLVYVAPNGTCFRGVSTARSNWTSSTKIALSKV